MSFRGFFSLVFGISLAFRIWLWSFAPASVVPLNAQLSTPHLHFGSSSATSERLFLQLIQRRIDLPAAELIHRQALHNLQFLPVTPDRERAKSNPSRTRNSRPNESPHCSNPPSPSASRSSAHYPPPHSPRSPRLDAPRALMIAAPRCCTVAIKSPFNHASSVITSVAACPSIFAL